MANIKNMEIGEAISKNERILIKSSLFGLKQTIIFKPTQSPIDVFQFEYTNEAGAKIEKILSTPPDKLEEAIKSVGKIEHSQIGSIHVEACIARDHQFVAIQPFTYSGFYYHPVVDLKVYEGKEAELIAALF